MGNRINYGISKRKNTEVCIEEINAALKSGVFKKIILLVPEQFSSYYEQLLVEKSIEQGSFFIEVLTFKRLTYRIFAKNLSKSDKYIDNAGKSMLMYKVISGMSDKFEAFAKAGKYPAFTGEAINSIREFKRYGLAPEAIEEAAQKAGGGLLKNKLLEMSMIYKEYDKQLNENGYDDAEDNLMELSGLLNLDSEINGAGIWVDGFDGFTPAEMDVVSALINTAGEITFSFCCKSLDLPDRTDVFYPVSKTASLIKKASEKLGIFIVENPIIQQERAMSGRPGELEHLASQYFEYPGIRYMGSHSNITLYKAETVYEEVRRCALEITRLVRKGEMRYGDICVVSGLYEEYREYIDAVFNKYDIPVFLDEKRSIAKHPLSSYILSLLDIYTSNYSYSAVMSYLKSSYTEIDYDDISILDNYIRQWDIKGTGTWTNGDWDYYISSANGDVLLKSINSTRKKIVNVLEPFFGKIRYGIAAKDFSGELYNFLVKNGVYRKIAEDVKEAENEGRLDYADELKQSWNFLMDILNQIYIIYEDVKQSAEKYRIMIELAFAQKKMGVIPPRTDEVFAGSINKAYGIKVKMLIVLGANDPGFPEKKVSEGLLTDKDRSDIKRLGIDIAPDTKEQVMNSLIDIYNLLNLPEIKLFVSYAENGIDGSKRRKSGFFDRLDDLFEDIAEENIHDANIEDYIATPLTGLDEIFGASSLLSFKKMFSGLNKTGLGRWYMENGLPVTGNTGDNQNDGLEFREVLLKLLGNVIESSPTVIENYIRCPYKYFAENALGILDRKDFNVSAPDIGSIIHSILKTLVGSYINDETADPEKYLSDAAKTLDNLKLGRVYSRDERFAYLGKRIASRAVDSFLILKKQLEAGEFRPIELEAAFGRGLSITAPSFSIGEHSIYLKGRIDRIDGTIIGDDEYFRVIDYKSSDKSLKLYRINEGLDIQLAAYLMAYESYIGTKPAGMYYFTTNNPIIAMEYGFNHDDLESKKFSNGKMEGYTLANADVYKAMDREFDISSEIIPVKFDKKNNKYKKTLTEEEIGAMTDAVRSIIADSTEKIFSCEFPVIPVNAEGIACDYCSYKSICGFDIRKPGCNYRQIRKLEDEDVSWGMHE